MSTQNTVNLFAKQSQNGTGLDGLHRAGGFLDAGYTLTAQNQLTIEQVDDNYVYTVDGENVSVASEVLAYAWLELPLSITGKLDDKKAAIVERLKLLQAGFLTKQQSTFVAGDGKKEAKPAEQAKRLLTASEYLNNCLKLASINVVDLYDKLDKFNDKSTKADLLHFVVELKNSLVTDEQKAVYEVMVEKEGALNSLKELGFSDFKRYAGQNNIDTFNAVISSDDWRNAKSELQKSFKFICAIAKDKDEFDIPVSFTVTFQALPETDDNNAG